MVVRHFLFLFLSVWLLLVETNGKAPCIGAIIRPSDDHLIVAFQFAVQWVKQRLYMKEDSLDLRMKIVDPNNFYQASKLVCALAEEGCVAIFGPPEPRISNHLEALTDQLSIPYFKIHSDTNKASGLSINLFPQDQLVNAIIDLIIHWDLSQLVVVYKNSEKLMRLKLLLESRKLLHLRLSLIKIDHGDYLAAADRLSNIDICSPHPTLCTIHSRRVLLDLDSADVHQFLLAALQFGLVNAEHWYLLTSLDIRELDLSLFSHNHVRITGFELLNQSTQMDYTIFFNHVKSRWNETHKRTTYFPMTETILMFDAVYVFASSHLKMLPSGSLKHHAQCSSHLGTNMVTNKGGATLYNTINTLLTHGLSGNLMFSQGKRTFLSLTIHQMDYDGKIHPIGSWASLNHSSKVTINSTLDHSLITSLRVREKIKPHHMIVTTIEENPYVMVKKKEGLMGNARFEGFCIDLLNKLTEKLPFTYTIHLVKDKRYGNEVNESWDGMIGEILRGEADMAVAPLTVTYKRAQVVDFTKGSLHKLHNLLMTRKPFLSLGISILYRIPGEQQPSLFSFMNPLSMDIWLYILVAIVSVTGAMFIIARITPYEWNPVRSSCYFGGVSHHSTYILDPRCPAPPPPPPVELMNNFSFRNTMWYVASTLMKGGSDIGPRAVSSRLLGGVWWVFSLVIVSAYTANLGIKPKLPDTFLTRQSLKGSSLNYVAPLVRRYIPIKSMEDLANQSEVAYGAVSGGSTLQFFKESQIETHKRMWQQMASRLDMVAVSGNREGVNWVMEKNYAFLMESASLEYEVVQNCNLTQVGGVLGSKGYGIALKKRSAWTDKISREILNFGERGEIELIKSKWWKKSAANCAGSSASMKQSRVSLNMQNVSGLFVILLAGITLGVVSVIIEFFVRTRQNAVADNV